MSGINKVILIGRLGQDPETKYLPSGNAVTNISVATSEKWKDKNTGQQQEKTEWHRIVFFNKLAEIAGEYLRKGSNVYIEGKIETRKWQDQSGQDRYSTEIKAHSMQMLDGKVNQGDASQQPPAQQVPQNPQPQQPVGYGQPPAVKTQADNLAMPHDNKEAQTQGVDNFDDDIPF